jgi:hypothetical protein
MPIALLLAALSDPQLSVYAGAGSLAADTGPGAALEGGVRLQAGEHFAATFDLGYGVLGWTHGVQDRWWIAPALAFTFSAGPVRVDLGAGLGLGASSGYASWRAYFDAPFTPEWAFQLVPMARVHATATLVSTSRLHLFIRAEGAALILAGNGIGSRQGNAAYGFGDTSWAHLVIGGQLGVF